MSKKGKRQRKRKQAAKTHTKSITQPHSLMTACVTPAQHVLSINDMHLWAGGYLCVDTEHAEPWDLVISLAQNLTDPPITFQQGAEKLIDPSALLLPQAPTIDIAWTDGGAPWQLDQDFWIALIKELARLKGNVLIHCFGGHGRTGTALAALVGLMADAGFKMPTEIPCVVSWVREHYNPYAVETLIQLRYLNNLLDLPVRDEIFDRMEKVESFYLNDYHNLSTLGYETDKHG